MKYSYGIDMTNWNIGFEIHNSKILGKKVYRITFLCFVLLVWWPK